MAEEWFEDELGWLGPPPQLPPKREQPQPTPPVRRTPQSSTRPRVSAHASAAAVPAYPQAPDPVWTADVAVPPYIRAPQRRYGEFVALKWLGVLLILVATLTATALLMRDFRADPEPSAAPAAQLVIPVAADSGGNEPVPAIAPNPGFAGKVICLDAAHGGIDRGFERIGDSTAPAMDEALYTAAYARELAGQLTTLGFTVVSTRDGDTVRNTESQDVNGDGLTRENATNEAEAELNAQLDEFQSRIDFCNREQADLLISLHFDGSIDPNESGYSTWYAEGRPDSGESQRLAELINQQLGADLAAAGIAVLDRGRYAGIGRCSPGQSDGLRLALHDYG